APTPRIPGLRPRGRLSPVFLGAVFCAGLLVAGCGASDDTSGGVGGSGGSGAQTGASSIEFASQSTLELEPLQAVNLRVQVKPAARHAVRFSLNGDSLDASLAATEVTTGDDGVAETTLFAPSKVASFSVRGAVGTE